MTDTQMGPWEAEMTRLGAEGAVQILSRALTEAVLCAPRPPVRAAVRFGCASIEVEWPAPTVTGPAADALAESLAEEQVPEFAGHLLRSELVGTFYRSAEPGAKPFVEVGDFVEPDAQVGIVEAMKLMNPIVAGVSGRVTEILVGDAEPVEYDQPLLVIEPGVDE